MCLEDIDHGKQDLVKNIKAESIYEDAGIIVNYIVLGNQINVICQEDIQKDQIPAECSVVSSLAESLALEYCSPARSVKDIYSEHAKKEVIDRHDEYPERSREYHHYKKEERITDIKNYGRQRHGNCRALVIGYIIPEMPEL